VPGVFEEEVGEEAAPAQLRGLRSVGEGLDGAGEEGAERGEAGLAVLVLREVVVGLQALEPDAALDGVLADGVIGVVVYGEEGAGDAVVGAYVRACSGDGGGSVRGCGAGDDDGVGGNTRANARRERLLGGGDFPEEGEARARDADACDVDEAGREDVLLLAAENLLAKALVD
jgi:hypothetical protein